MENVEKSEEAANLYIECPAINENSACPCYKFEDGELHQKFVLQPLINILIIFLHGLISLENLKTETYKNSLKKINS